MLKKEFLLVSSLEKVLPNVRPKELPVGTRLSTWPGARAAVQLAYHMACDVGEDVTCILETFSVSVEGAPCPVSVRKTQLVPVELPCQPGADDYFISKQAGLYPDLLLPLTQPRIPFVCNQYRSLWLTFDLPADTPAGVYPITIRLNNPDGVHNPCTGVFEPREAHEADDRTLSFVLNVGKSQLPPSRVSHLHLFYPDCLADYYHAEPWTEEFWQLVENYLRFASEHNFHEINLPHLTVSMDVAKTADRTTTQLLDVYLNDGVFTFGFDKIERWCRLCKKYGINTLFINPMFSQWGATHSVKVIATVDGVQKRIFGWDVPVTEPLYARFLDAMVPQLRAHLAEYGFDDAHVIWSASDEPQPDQVDSYERAWSMLSPHLRGATFVESLNSVEFYQRGIIDTPEPPLDYVDEFIEAGVEKLATYFCVAQVRDVPNNYICMPSQRCRILGVLLYLYRQIFRLSHWGYNFYNTRYSYGHIDPFTSINADWCFPAADSYIVYPGPDGQPYSSIRAEVLDDVFYDLRSLQLLESLTSREFVLSLIYEHAGMDKITMRHYPRSDEYLLALRERVADELARRQ